MWLGEEKCVSYMCTKYSLRSIKIVSEKLKEKSGSKYLKI